MRVLYHEAAESELLAEVRYLEARSPGLGARFLEEVRRTEESISAFPHSSDRFEKGTRRRPLQKFPFSICYSTEPDHILAIASQHRRPGYWIRRAPE